MEGEERGRLEAYCRTRNLELRNALAEEYLYLAKAVARRFAGRGAEVEDLFQVASVALLGALERFDCGLGVRFSTYAAPTLAGAVRNYLRDRAGALRLPRRGAELLPRIEREREAFFKRAGREPSAQELADALGLPVDDVLDALVMRGADRTVSLDAESEDGEGAALARLLGREEADYERVEREDQIARLLNGLTETGRFVIRERFLRQRSQRDIARDMGVSQMQVSRLERKALAALKAAVI